MMTKTRLRYYIDIVVISSAVACLAGVEFYFATLDRKVAPAAVIGVFVGLICAASIALFFRNAPRYSGNGPQARRRRMVGSQHDAVAWLLVVVGLMALTAVLLSYARLSLWLASLSFVAVQVAIWLGLRWRRRSR